MSRDAPPRRLSAAAGTIGAVLGLILVLTGVTGGIAAYRLWHVQQTLDRAAAAAATSEAQNGCWTFATSQIVNQVLKGGGLPVTGSNAVQVTQYTDAQNQPVSYGQLVTAGLSWSVPISVVRLQLPTSVPLSATVTQASQYVSAVAGGGSQCTAPSVAACQTVTTYQQSCQPVTTQQCKTQYQTVCGTSYQTQCGSSYSCTSQPSCGYHTTTVCQTEETYGLIAYINGRPWYGWHSTYVCNPVTQYSCTTQQVCGYHYSCWSVPVSNCHQQPVQTCQPVTTQQCTTVPVTTTQCG